MYTNADTVRHCWSSENSPLRALERVSLLLKSHLLVFLSIEPCRYHEATNQLTILPSERGSVILQDPQFCFTGWFFSVVLRKFSVVFTATIRVGCKMVSGTECRDSKNENMKLCDSDTSHFQWIKDFGGWQLLWKGGTTLLTQKSLWMNECIELYKVGRMRGSRWLLQSSEPVNARILSSVCD